MNGMYVSTNSEGGKLREAVVDHLARQQNILGTMKKEDCFRNESIIYFR